MGFLENAPRIEAANKSLTGSLGPCTQADLGFGALFRRQPKLEAFTHATFSSIISPGRLNTNDWAIQDQVLLSPFLVPSVFAWISKAG